MVNNQRTCGTQEARGCVCGLTRLLNEANCAANADNVTDAPCHTRILCSATLFIEINGGNHAEGARLGIKHGSPSVGASDSVCLKPVVRLKR
jgi:hypothetical protein